MIFSFCCGVDLRGLQKVSVRTRHLAPAMHGCPWSCIYWLMEDETTNCALLRLWAEDNNIQGLFALFFFALFHSFSLQAWGASHQTQVLR